MLQLKTRHRVLFVVCAGLSLGQVYPNMFCAKIPPGDWRRAPECIVPVPTCYVVSGLCRNSKGADVQYSSILIYENEYVVCRDPGYPVCYRCRVLNSRQRCVDIVYLSERCSGTVLCVEGPELNECETDTSGCGSG
jgi:hypothetical protein